MIASFKKNQKGIILMLLSSLCVCFGQLFWKISVNDNYFFLCMGFVLYGIGALLMIVAYKYGKLSVLQPLLSISYVISIILAVTVLHEIISLMKLIGILVIILGVVMVAGGDNE